jgi:predicted ATPase
MRALYRSGRPGEALDSYEELRVRLADELGLDPGPDLIALHRSVLARDLALDPPSPPPTVRPRSNLPAALSELIGRDEAVAGIRAGLATGRLVTLTGPGGVGKTRLALATAGGLVDDLADGAWLAELGVLEPGSAGRPADVVTAALDVHDVTGADDRLVDALRARRMLLVLDNCEHVIDQAAALAGRLLRGCPGLRILATSREPLGCPARWSGPSRRSTCPRSPRAAMPCSSPRSPAVRLFVARAAAAASGFALDPDTAPAVAELCRRLDGIPLALELAATRVRALGVDELVARLDDRFRLAHGPDGPRYRLLESVAAYCGDRLAEAGETERVRDRHGRYYTALAVRAGERLYGHDQRRWLRRLDTETANLRSALDHAVRHGGAERALRLVGALTWYWFLRGRLTEARRSLRTALTASGR